MALLARHCAPSSRGAHAVSARLQACRAAACARLPRRGAGRLAVRRQNSSRPARRRSVAAASAAWGGAASDSWQPPSGTERQRALLKFVEEVDPVVMQQFEDAAHPEVIIAMRQTITSMLGTLPPQFFRVVISTDAENLAQLMYSVLMSGYMFANAWTRLSLTRSMAELPPGPPTGLAPELARSSSSLASVSSGGSMDGLEEGGSAAALYAPGSQKVQIEGEVLRWHHENGKEVVPALQYIEQLESELATLRQQMESQAAAFERAAATDTKFAPMPGNELLDYLKCLTADELVALTDCASEDVLDAMNIFVQRLMGMEEDTWQGGTSDCTAGELAQLMYWLMITGYELRSLEQRLNLTRTLDLPPPGPEPPSLPPGRLR
ncbi:hypothetical protein D9Q98_008197 [Chlorella vulgaris]|uniref:Seed maturation n=1 Tax=Chlorella vulgaris TaxID=3077 RepID=A0A9D4TG49_CHLVU|nr:hypothetical protein D9Q98_008197 [Chlorella vulgaris]